MFLRLGLGRRFRKYRISLEGYALLGLMAIIGFAAWHSGANLVYLIFALLIAIFLVHGLLVWLCLRRVDVSRRLPIVANALEETTVYVTLNNRRRWMAAYALRVIDYFKSGEPAGVGFAVRVPARGMADAPYRVIFPRRGRYEFSQMIALTRFPFALVERGLVVHRPQSLIVYPALFEAGEVAAEILKVLGEQEARSKGSGTEFYGLRDYSRAEHTAKRIHWRSSVKTGRLMVMEYEREEMRRVTLALMNAVPDQANGSVAGSNRAGNGADRQSAAADFELAVAMTGSLARHLLSEGYEIRLTTSERTTPFSSDPAHIDRMLRILATVEPEVARRAVTTRAPEGLLIQIAFRDPLPPRGRESWLARIIDAREWEVREGAFVRREVLAA